MRKLGGFLLFWLAGALFSGAHGQCFLAYNPQNQPVETFCVGEQITFKDNSGQTNVAEFYDFDNRDGLDFSAKQTSHIFTAPGTYVVTQLANGFNQCPRTFTVKAAAPPSAPFLEKITLQTSSLQIQLQTSGVNDLVVERASSPAGSYTAVQTFSNVPAGRSQHSVAITNPAGCFRVRVTNICSGREDIFSNTVCAQSLTVTPGDRQNQLSWSVNESPGSVVNYQILRSGQPYQNLPGIQTAFTDTQVACGRLYTYQVVALLQNSSQSASLPVQVETKGSTAPAAPFLLTSFDLQNRVMLQTTIPAQETFREQAIYRSQGNGVLSLFSEKQPQNAVDATAGNQSAPLCYQVAYTDSCQLVSPRSNLACPVILSASLQANGAVKLNWNAYEGFPSGVGRQTLELVNEQGEVYWSQTVTGQSYLDAQPQKTFQRLRYRLLSVSQDGTYQSYSSITTLDQGFQFHFPTAFTPNRDGLNDVFRAVGTPFASSFHLQVLNRWGQVVFESKDPKLGWDGTYAGKPAPPETYLYRFEATDVNGKKVTSKGTVTLLR
ncbi:T9SS type B sorting domain-containing protein [Rufibacter radiotolerans]|uniref:T9SS type B sorting domain-containing protein n=1 Tax=Rufibacter radiotolerans TaxID=1379910 RepID=UPI000ACEFD44|nr:T9SS type B sorting domain-containing protein [Rufibacter radiotolerans]